MAAVRSEWVQGPAGKLSVTYYEAHTDENAVPLVLVHPVNTGAGIWRKVAPMLAPDRAIIVPDLRGHGLSDQHGPFAASDYAADIVSTLDHYGISRAHIAGGSVGGPVGVLLAAHHPDRIVSIASFGGALRLYLPEVAIELLSGMAAQLGGDGLLRELLPSAFGTPKRAPALIEEAIEIAGGRDGDLILALIRGTFATDVSREAALVDVPALIVNGSEDATCPPEAGQEMAAALRSTAFRLDGVGHLPMIEAPERVAEWLRAHCARAENRRG